MFASQLHPGYLEKVLVAASRKLKTLSESEIPAWFAVSVKTLTNDSVINVRRSKGSRAIRVERQLLSSQDQLSRTPLGDQTKIPTLVILS
jgi:hypothetical protein